MLIVCPIIRTVEEVFKCIKNNNNTASWRELCTDDVLKFPRKLNIIAEGSNGFPSPQPHISTVAKNIQESVRLPYIYYISVFQTI